MENVLSNVHDLAWKVMCELEALQELGGIGDDTIEELEKLHGEMDDIQSRLYDLMEKQKCKKL